MIGGDAIAAEAIGETGSVVVVVDFLTPAGSNRRQPRRRHDWLEPEDFRAPWDKPALEREVRRTYARIIRISGTTPPEVQQLREELAADSFDVHALRYHLHHARLALKALADAEEDDIETLFLMVA